jgi:hypothetical protein
MDDGNRDYCTTTDLILQTESHRSMICEQGDTIPRDRHEAFMSCGIISRVGSLLIFSKKEKMKALLTGSVLDTTSIICFAVCIRVVSTACPKNYVGMIQVLKNLQTVLQIVFSTAFAKCLEEFIEHLEGEIRPMESVASDFLKDSVELAAIKRIAPSNILRWPGSHRQSCSR